MITETAPIEAPSSRLSGRRRALVWALVVLASLIGLGSILTTWVHRQMLDEQAWRDASAVAMSPITRAPPCEAVPRRGNGAAMAIRRCASGGPSAANGSSSMASA